MSLVMELSKTNFMVRFYVVSSVHYDKVKTVTPTNAPF